jgi:predicted acyltransferase
MMAQVPERLLSLDIFRGVTIAAMILVNNLVYWSDSLRVLRLTHAEWNGCNFADLIFPFFIFIVGVSSDFSLEKRANTEETLARYRHILVRTAVLFFLGLLTGSGLIFGWLFQVICPPVETQKSIWAIFLSPPPGAEVYFFSLANLRIPGVLQRIALVYLPLSIILIHTRWRVQALLTGGLLLLYWGLMSLPGFPMQPGEDLGAAIDRAVFGGAHLWRHTRTWDPEGLLGTLPAIATGLLGALTGHWLHSDWERHRKLTGLLLAGFLAIIAGAAWALVFPLNKYLWTSSYVVYTAGFALIFLGFWYWLADVQQWRTLLVQPFVWLGMNPLLAYCGAQLGSLALSVLYLGTPTEHTHLSALIMKRLFGEDWGGAGLTWLSDPIWPSLFWALIYLSFWTLLMGIFYRKRLFFKI